MDVTLPADLRKQVEQELASGRYWGPDSGDNPHVGIEARGPNSLTAHLEAELRAQFRDA